ncbi:MAG: CtsR family transcriptional regulator [Candidatus Thorarchaeota archaeon]
MQLTLPDDISQKLEQIAQKLETTPERICEVILTRFVTHRGSLIEGRREIVIEWPPREKYGIIPKEVL